MIWTNQKGQSKSIKKKFLANFKFKRIDRSSITISMFENNHEEDNKSCLKILTVFKS